MSQLSKSAQKVQDALKERGFPFAVRELEESARTAQAAADALGCTVGQIVKSLIFQGADSKQPILLLVSGSNRVDTDLVAPIIGEVLERANPAFVREVTGFAIGGIPPLGHTEKLKTYIDKDLLQYSEVWAAAGTPHAVFPLSSEALLSLAPRERIIAVC